MKAIAAIQAGNSEKGRKLFLEGITKAERCKELLQNLGFMELNEENYHLACSLYQKMLPLIERKEYYSTKKIDNNIHLHVLRKSKKKLDSQFNSLLKALKDCILFTVFGLVNFLSGGRFLCYS